MKGFIRFLGFMFLVYIIINSLIMNLPEIEEIPVKETCSDGFEALEDKDRMHQRNWYSVSFPESFCADYLSSDSISNFSELRRNKMTQAAYSYEDLWGTVYGNLVKDSKSTLGFLVDSLRTLGQQKRLSQARLAEMVVSFVQDIPYSYVLNIDCEDYATGSKPCLGNVKLGLLSPYEFIHSLYGDCDTRAVLIYALLEELGFDPMIVVSDEYAHAMLALGIPASGDHLTHRGKNYYFWETTATGWPIGMLPPSTNNVNYWKIALVNEL